MSDVRSDRWLLVGVPALRPAIDRVETYIRKGRALTEGEEIEVAPMAGVERLRVALERISNTKSIDLAQGIALSALAGFDTSDTVAPPSKDRP